VFYRSFFSVALRFFVFLKMQICSVSFLDGQQAPGGDNRICAHYGVDLSTAKKFLRQSVSVGGVISSFSFFCRMTPSIFFSCALYPLFFRDGQAANNWPLLGQRESASPMKNGGFFSHLTAFFSLNQKKVFPPSNVSNRGRERESWRDALLVADNGLCVLIIFYLIPLYVYY
jgi:hypothetical protein